eukprot:SAG22_NODE_815_length_7037_cov_6.192130_2_plen_107_part_00
MFVLRGRANSLLPGSCSDTVTSISVQVAAEHKELEEKREAVGALEAKVEKLEQEANEYKDHLERLQSMGDLKDSEKLTGECRWPDAGSAHIFKPGSRSQTAQRAHC